MRARNQSRRKGKKQTENKGSRPGPRTVFLHLDCILPRDLQCGLCHLSLAELVYIPAVALLPDELKHRSCWVS
jgi:hypothetical protein